MSSDSLFLRTLRGERTERPPIWMMRQAGRILPEYRELRASLSGFKELVETPDLAAEATCQPIDRLGVDAAIVFSDILTVPEGLGLPYEMIPGFGPRFPKVIEQPGDIDKLHSPQEAADSLEYVYGAVSASVKRLAGRVPLIGFAGAPWTIFCYMIEGQGSKTFSKARKWLMQEEAASMRLLELIADTTAIYLKAQIAAGAQAVQLFDSWAGVLSPKLYRKFALPASQRTLAQLADAGVPRIFFAKGAGHSMQVLAEAEAYGIDWTVPASAARATYGKATVLQGNLDPAALYGSPQSVEVEVKEMLRSFGQHHIANLGHGLYPDTQLPAVEAFVNTVKSFRYSEEAIAPV